mgnify:FL=1
MFLRINLQYVDWIYQNFDYKHKSNQLIFKMPDCLKILVNIRRLFMMECPKLINLMTFIFQMPRIFYLLVFN